MGFTFTTGSFPILVSIPHNGSAIPTEIASTMTTDGQSSRDTDWFLDRLYNIPELQDVSWLIAEDSRYVIDLNRPKSNQSLYPGQTTTGLVPETCFDGAPIYREGDLPDKAEVDRRIKEIWEPYHQTLEDELTRLVSVNSVAVLIEAHSIASRVPRLFEGQLPDFNIGTNRGATCAPELEAAILTTLKDQPFSHVVNGRFLGGHITRHFGRPELNRHAVQIELSQATYMKESSLEWDDEKAASVQPVFREIMQTVRQWLRC